MKRGCADKDNFFDVALNGDGGGLENKGTATLTNVNITANQANDRGGAISNSGTLTMTGGSITNNVSNDNVESSGGGAIYTYKGSNTTLTGVTITGNQAKIAGGGAINSLGTVTLDGCTITGNSSKNGGAIWTVGGSALNMQGKNTITDNTVNGNTNNVYLNNGVVITVTGSLEGSKIGVHMQTPGTFTSGFGANNEKAPLAYFFSDNSGYTIAASDNEAKLVKSMETGIDGVEQSAFDDQHDSWYDLKGHKLYGKPTTKGIYINNGKKVVIK